MKKSKKQYRKDVIDFDKEWRKLEKAHRKYEQILEDIEREMEYLETQCQRSIHCFTLQEAETEQSIVA